MNNPLDNKERAGLAKIFFYIITLMSVVGLISDFMEYQLLSSASISIASAEENDGRQLIIGVISGMAQIGLIIVFIQWFRRAYHNLHKAKVSNLSTSEGWAAGAWFVPIVSLFRPYQIMMEIWNKTKEYVRSHSVDDSSIDFETDSRASSSSIVGIWWAFWIASSIAGNISFQIARRAETLEALVNASMMSLIADVASIGAALCAIKMINESQIMQDKFFRAYKDNANEAGKGNIVLSDSDDILI